MMNRTFVWRAGRRAGRLRSRLAALAGTLLVACAGERADAPDARVDADGDPLAEDAGARAATDLRDGPGDAAEPPDVAGAGDAGDGAEGGRDAAFAVGLPARPVNRTCRPPLDPEAPAATLRATGCVDADDPRRPAPGLIPYDIASPLWSDGADKQRFLALPEGATIAVKDCGREPAACAPPSAGGTPGSDGKLELPAGSVLVKSFLFGGRFIETRLLVRLSDGSWAGYSYAWREDQRDADLVEDAFGGVTRAVRDAEDRPLDWTFPSRQMCLDCHTAAAGGSIGPELRQLNRDFRFANGVTENQLDAYERVGLFSVPLPRPLPDPYPSPSTDAGSVAARARSYLHANCASCHRPGGSFDGIDLRFEAPLAAMNLCDVAPERGTLGVEGAQRLVPGRPELSTLTLRMRALDFNRMPRIGTRVVDTVGVAAVEAWIAELTGCP